MAIDYNEMISQLAREIVDATERMGDGTWVEDDLPTAADLARKLNYRIDVVKKKLRLLKEAGLIQPISVTPKRYRFNAWALKSLDADHPFHALFAQPEPEWED
jgi:hypothetical protein